MKNNPNHAASYYCPYQWAWSRIIAVLLLILFPRFAIADLPETSHDGLQRVPSKEVQVLYVKPGATLAPYNQVAMFECFVAFRKNWKSDQNSAYLKVTASDMEKIKQELSDEFRKIFTEELQKGGYVMTNKAGEGVLILRPAIIDLDITAPDVMQSGRAKTFTTNAGSMTLFLELYDGVTGEILARVVDPQQARDNVRMMWQTSVSNRAEADYTLRKWAALMRTALDRARNQPKAAA